MHPHDPIAAALDHCLSAPTTVPPLDSVDQWWPGWAALAAQPSSPMALALRGGFAADRVGWAFAAGYQSALRTLVPSLPVQALAAFCVTEEGGNRPRDIRTLITPGAGGGFHVSGSKRWTTLGPQGTLLLVTGRLAGAATDERPALKVAAGAGRSAGRHDRANARDRVRARGAPRAHPPPGRGDRRREPVARRRLQQLRQAVPHPGRHLCDRSGAGLPAARGTGARLAGRPARAPFGALSALAMVAQSHRDAPTTHVALAGALHWAAALYDEAGALWATTPEDPASRRWLRDAPLFAWPPALASSARRAPGSGFRPDLLFLQSARLVKTYTTG
jgi:acyl-CoA dehydrogenase